MKYIDNTLGWLICNLLGFIEVFSRLFRKKTEKRMLTVRNILFTKYFGMGSILLATPMFDALKKRWPQAKFNILTFEDTGEFCQILNIFDEILKIRTSNFFIFGKDLLTQLYYLRKKQLDIVIDLEFFAKFPTMVAYLCRANVKVGFRLKAGWRKRLLTHETYFNHYKHITRIFLAMAETVGAKADENIAPHLLKPSLQAQQELNDVLKKHNLDKDVSPLVVNVNANELCHERRWPANNFVYLIKKIIKEFPSIKVFLTGTSKEKNYTGNVFQQIANQNKNVYDFSGKLNLQQLLALLKRAILFITNDSGPLHFAASLGTPTISFFGPETPLLYGPIGNGHTVFYKGLYCSPCLSAYDAKTALCQGNNKCMQAIGVNEVFEKAKEYLKESISY